MTELFTNIWNWVERGAGVQLLLIRKYDSQMLLEKCGNISTSCNAHPMPCVCWHWCHLPPAQRALLSFFSLLHFCTSLSPSPAALDFWKMEKEGKEVGFRDIGRQRDGKGDRVRDEASLCLKSWTIKSQAVQDIDKSFYVDVLSISFQLMYNHFSSGKNRNPVLWNILQDPSTFLYSLHILFLHCFLSSLINKRTDYSASVGHFPN